MDVFGSYLSAQRLTEGLLRADTMSAFAQKHDEAEWHIERALKEFDVLAKKIAALRAAHEQKEAA